MVVKVDKSEKDIMSACKGRTRAGRANFLRKKKEAVYFAFEVLTRIGNFKGLLHTAYFPAAIVNVSV